MSFGVNLDGVEESGKAPFGKFKTRIVEVKKKESKNGNMMAVVKFTIVGDKYKGYNFYDNFVLSNSTALSRLVSLVKSSGGSIAAANENLPGEILNKVIELDVKESKKDGAMKDYYIAGFKKIEDDQTGESF